MPGEDTHSHSAGVTVQVGGGGVDEGGGGGASSTLKVYHLPGHQTGIAVR